MRKVVDVVINEPGAGSLSGHPLPIMKRRNNGVTFWRLHDLIESASTCQVQIKLTGFEQGSRYVPARPLGWTDIPHRLRAMWIVWTGRADVVTWPAGQ